MASSYKSSNIQRGKPYALMLLLAFGAAVLGVMVLHKLREKRIFSLLVKEKDHELLTLHLLFQREQEFNKDARKKIEEMKTKVYSLRSQKLELDRRLSEMESTIASMRDEREVIESTLEEKKNEIKMLTEEGLNSTFPQVSTLRDMIKMKEREIEHLKLRLNTTETNSTDVGKRLKGENDIESTVNGLSEKVTIGENKSQTNSILDGNRDNITNETEQINDLDEDEPQMRQEAALHKWVTMQGENTGNETSLINQDENQEKKTADLQSTGMRNPTEKVINTNSTHHDNPQYQESREMTSSVRSGLKSEKSDKGVDGASTRARRYSRGKRLRDGQATETSALGNQEETIKSNNNQREVGLTEVYPAETEILNQTLGSTETKPKGTEKTDKGSSTSKDGNVKGNGNGTRKLTIDGESERRADTEANVRKQKEEINSGHDIDANRKLLKMRNINVSKNKYDDEGKEIEVEEGEGDDLDDTHEPEIDREDIKRFAESDPDEEEAEEAADEAEF